MGPRKRLATIKLVIVVAFLITGATYVCADTLTASGSGTYTLTGSDSYSYCSPSYECYSNVFPHTASFGNTVSLTLSPLTPGALADASVSVGGIQNISTQVYSNGDLWNVSGTGAFSTITVGSVTDSLGGIASGTVALTDPALLAALGNGDSITLGINYSLLISPVSGTANGSSFQYYTGTTCYPFSGCYDHYAWGSGYWSSISNVAYTINPQATLTASTAVLDAPVTVPEPASLLLLGTGLIAASGALRRKLHQ